MNAVAPGAIDTPLNANAYTPEVRRTYEHRIPRPDRVCGRGAESSSSQRLRHAVTGQELSSTVA